MRLYPPIYPEDGMLQPGTFPGGDVTGTSETSASSMPLVRSNMRIESIAEVEADVDAQVRQAKAARGAWVGSQLKPYFEALMRKFARGGPSEMEKYLAASQNLAELEERIVRFQSMQSRHL